MILPSRPTWLISASAAVLVIGVATWAIISSGSCDDNRPALDERVSEQGKRLGEAKERAAEVGDDQSLANLRNRRTTFAGESEAQLVALATEIERRATLPATPTEPIEQLRRDHLHLREQRQRVIDSGDAAFEENLLAFETQVNTVREQLARLDGGKLP